MKTTEILEQLKKTQSHEPTFLQAVEEFLYSVEDYLETSVTAEQDYQIICRLLVPERVVSFRVDWTDDSGLVQHNVGYRVQFNSVLGPYKGGLRFDPSVNEDVLKFLGFEQVFKNALTGLRLGGGKGGSNFNPKGKSHNEIRSFCRAFMLSLHRYIGIERDVPAGDIGVGAREIGYMYGMYKQITGTNDGVLSGKDELFGGACNRTQATGWGVVYFAEAMAKQHDISLAGMKAAVSGSGNVAEHTALKLIEKGAVVMTLSDRGGYLYKEDGLTAADIGVVSAGKKDHQSLKDISVTGAEYHEGKFWQTVEADAYFPCATQNEIDRADAEVMVQKAKLIVEGANMPLTAVALKVVQKSGVLYALGKASNAGGVSVSGLEMAQNASFHKWSCDKVNEELQKIMQHIHHQCVQYGKTEERIDYVRGANIAGFKRVLEATKKLGW